MYITSLYAFIIPILATAASIKRDLYPFETLVAFGDELSDNGNGSYAHGVTGNPAKVYGFGTWTNGPVAVSYLADLLSVPLVDFAFGGCCGGGSFGATLDNNYTASAAGSPSLADQVSNYTSSSCSQISSAMHFIWAGQNDLTKHTDAFWLGDPRNNQFAEEYASYTVASVQSLVTAGARYVFVSNMYPKHLSPVTKTYLCGQSNQACVDTWGKVIQKANSKLELELAQFGDQVIYYDSFGFISDLMDRATEFGFTKSTSSYCDGDSHNSWDECWEPGVGLVAEGFFWTNFVQPTTEVHKLIAADMQKTINRHFGMFGGL